MRGCKKLDLEFGKLSKRQETNKIIVHCSATKKSSKWVSGKDIHKWHLDRGWSGCGYHIVICLDGTIEICRPLDKIGSHTRGQNKESIGICIVGGLGEDMIGDTNAFEDIQFKKLGEVLKNLFVEYERVPVYPHNHYDQGKECPVFNLKEYMEVFNV